VVLTRSSPPQKNDVVKLRGRISRSPETERIFWTDAYLPNDPCLPEEDRAKYPVSIWSDIVFPSQQYNDVLYIYEVLNFDAALIMPVNVHSKKFQHHGKKKENADW
jgi:hypothetical protein